MTSVCERGGSVPKEQRRARHTDSKVPLGTKVDPVQDEKVEEGLEKLDAQNALGRLALSCEELERVEGQFLRERCVSRRHLQIRDTDAPCQAGRPSRDRSILPRELPRPWS